MTENQFLQELETALHQLPAEYENIQSEKLHAISDNGAIVLETRTHPENFTIHAEVDWGSISIFGSKKRKTIFGNGEHSIDLQSDNGSITVKLVN